jgi:hypothetical protein
MAKTIKTTVSKPVMKKKAPYGKEPPTPTTNRKLLYTREVYTGPGSKPAPKTTTPKKSEPLIPAPVDSPKVRTKKSTPYAKPVKTPSGAWFRRIDK